MKKEKLYLVMDDTVDTKKELFPVLPKEDTAFSKKIEELNGEYTKKRH